MKKIHQFFAGTLLLSIPGALQATSLNLGADYLLRGVSITERDKTISGNDYYDQRLQAYLTTDLSKDVEATIRIQSITPWGMEGSSTSTLTNTRYPSANGTPWVQNAFVRLPNIWKGNIVLTAGRQPMQWGDGDILSDDELGFNALRVNLKSPFRRIDFDIDAFTAKLAEGLQTDEDKDLHGVKLGFNQESIRWEVMGLFENSKTGPDQFYDVGASTFASTYAMSKSQRTIMGIRAISNLKDAYVKGAYYVQSGKVTSATGGSDIKLSGTAFRIGLGGKQDTKRFGRFGASVDYSEGSGDNGGSTEEDESFRPTQAKRFSGLERTGYGRYFAATFSDAYSPSDPFAPASATNDGLPPGASGIQTAHLGTELTPWAEWTFTLDYFQYKAIKNLSGPKELGIEFDYGVEYRYSGLVTFRASTNNFTPGKAFDEETRQKATFSHAEVAISF